MNDDWKPEPVDIAATRAARRDGSLHSLLRQQITEGQARRGTTPGRNWPASGARRDINGVTCPHCAAGPDQRCHLRTRDQALPKPHPQRVTAWVQLVACCPTCQSEPGIRCHLDGMPLPNGSVHAARYQEAEEVAA